MTRYYFATRDGVQTFINKTISADNNTITNLGLSNLKALTSTDSGNTFVVQSDGTWAITGIQQYKQVSTFAGVTGDTKTMYYLDTAYDVSHKIGLYVYNGTDFVNCTPTTTIEVDDITIQFNSSNKLEVKDGGLTVAKFNVDAISQSVPTTGASNSKVTTESAVRNAVNTAGATLDFSMDSTSFILTATLYDANGTALSTKTVDLPLEQMVVDVEYDNTNQQFVFTLKDGTKKYVPASGILRGVVTETATQSLSNKTINAENNTISNIDYDNLQPKTSADVNKAYIVQSNGSWGLSNIQQYKRLSTFSGEVGNVETLYYLDTAYTGYEKGMYIYDATSSSFILTSTSGGSVPVDNVTIDLNSLNQLEVKDGAITTSKIATGTLVTSIGDKSTDTEIPTAKAVYTFGESFVPYNEDTSTTDFGMGISSSDEIYLKGSTLNKTVVDTIGTQTIKNKSINSDENTITNIDVDDLKEHTASDTNKVFVTKSDGKWEYDYLNIVTVVSTLPSSPSTRLLYYLDTAYGSNKVGFYRSEDGSNYTYLSSQVTVDDTTIYINADGKLAVKDNGITKAKLNSNLVTTSLTSSSTDDQLPTAKTVYTSVTNLDETNFKKKDYSDVGKVLQLGSSSTAGKSDVVFDKIDTVNFKDHSTTEAGQVFGVKDDGTIGLITAGSTGIVDKAQYSNKTRDDIATKLSNAGTRYVHFTEVSFTAAESPDSLSTSVYNIDASETSSSTRVCLVATSYNSKNMYITTKFSGSWTSWKSIVGDFLPLAGGKMTGTITYDTSSMSGAPIIKGYNSTTSTTIAGGNGTADGAYITLNGKSTGDGGDFNITAYSDGSTQSYLKGTPGGSLSWNGNEVIRQDNVDGSTIEYDTVSSELKANVIIEVSELPSTDIKENSIYRVPILLTPEKRYNLSDEQIAAGSTLSSAGITLSDTTVISWETINSDWSTYQSYFQESDEGVAYVYNNGGEWWIQYGPTTIAEGVKLYTYRDDTWFTIVNTSGGYLPTSGGTMTGSITYTGSASAIKTNTNESQITIAGGNGTRNAARMTLYGADYDDEDFKGAFVLTSNGGEEATGQGLYSLKGTSTGELTWDDETITTIEDVETLPTPEEGINEHTFYRITRGITFVARWNLTQEQIEGGARVDSGGLITKDGGDYSWEDVNSNWEELVDTVFELDDSGPVYEYINAEGNQFVQYGPYSVDGTIVLYMYKNGYWHKLVDTQEKYLPTSGGTMTGPIAMSSSKITGLATPTAATDACTKAYTDTMLPLAGGTMTGPITSSTTDFMYRSVDNSALAFYGGSSTTKGACVAIRGMNNGGSVSLKTRNTDGTAGGELSVKPAQIYWTGIGFNVNDSVIVHSTNLSDQTRDTIKTIITDTYDEYNCLYIFPRVKFTAAESPNGKATSIFALAVFAYSSSLIYINALQGYGYTEAKCYYNNNAWTDWNGVKQTPTAGTGISFTDSGCTYVQNGRMVQVWGIISIAAGTYAFNQNILTGLPAATSNVYGTGTLTVGNTSYRLRMNGGGTAIHMLDSLTLTSASNGCFTFMYLAA